MSKPKYKIGQELFIIISDVFNHTKNFFNEKIIIKTKVTKVFLPDELNFIREGEVDYVFDCKNKSFFGSADHAWREQKKVFETKEKAVLYLQRSSFAEQIRVKDRILLDERKIQHLDKVLYMITYNKDYLNN